MKVQDSNGEFIENPNRYFNTNAYTYYVYVNADNAATFVFVDTAQGDFTARYRKIN